MKGKRKRQRDGKRILDISMREMDTGLGSLKQNSYRT